MSGETTTNGVQPDRMLPHFEFEHLPMSLRGISQEFSYLAHEMARRLAAGPERTVMLRKLLEAKDCAVRAKLRPGG